MKTIIILLLAVLAISAFAEGEMESGFCPCPRLLRPVCGTDNRTYANPCELKCAVKKGRSGKFPSDQSCVS